MTPFVKSVASIGVICSLVTAILLYTSTILAHALGNLGMIAFWDALLAEASRPDISQRPGGCPLVETVLKADVDLRRMIDYRCTHGTCPEALKLAPVIREWRGWVLWG